MENIDFFMLFFVRVVLDLEALYNWLIEYRGTKKNEMEF